MDLCQTAARPAGEDGSTSRPSALELVYAFRSPRSSIDFFDQLKSRTKGYASLDYEPAGTRDRQPREGRHLVERPARSTPSRRSCTAPRPTSTGGRWPHKLRELIPRQLFDVPIQAAIGGRIIARETVKAKRKDVLAKCYGGDITRKRKLLEKQKEGKKRMKSIGRVEVPQEAFISALEARGMTWPSHPGRPAAGGRSRCRRRRSVLPHERPLPSGAGRPK